MTSGAGAVRRRLATWRAKREHRRQLAAMAGPRLLSAFAAAYPEAFFVEIGANDGEQHDHLRPLILANPWRGIMVEPVPYVFARLQANYGGHDRIALENAAIADRDGELPFYYVRDASPEERATLPDWYDAIGSFSRDAVMSHERHIPDIAQRIVEARVPALTFASLLARHGTAGVDLVLVDTEGYDWEVVRAIDLETHRPRLLIFEHYHLTDAVREQARAHLRGHGFELLEEGFDTFCLDARIDDELLRTFRAMRPAVAGVSIHDEAR